MKNKKTYPFFGVGKDSDLEFLLKFVKDCFWDSSKDGWKFFDDSTADKKDNYMIRLLYDKSPDADHTWGVKTKGIVVCSNKRLVSQVRELIVKEINWEPKNYEVIA